MAGARPCARWFQSRAFITTSLGRSTSSCAPIAAASPSAPRGTGCGLRDLRHRSPTAAAPRGVRPRPTGVLATYRDAVDTQRTLAATSAAAASARLHRRRLGGPVAGGTASSSAATSRGCASRGALASWQVRNFLYTACSFTAAAQPCPVHSYASSRSSPLRVRWCSGLDLAADMSDAPLRAAPGPAAAPPSEAATDAPQAAACSAQNGWLRGRTGDPSDWGRAASSDAAAAAAAHARVRPSCTSAWRRRGACGSRASLARRSKCGRARQQCGYYVPRGAARGQPAATRACVARGHVT